MNKTRIEWCDSTWNPITGCRHNCPYCYAREMVKRFGCSDGSDSELFVLNAPYREMDINCSTGETVYGKIEPYPYGFSLTFHRYRLNDYVGKKKGRNIFVCSMSDLFGEWVPDSWIEDVFKACDAVPWHTYMFLTKNPERYMELTKKGIIRTGDNFWYGSTATTPEVEFFWHDQLNTFVSIEPILASFPDEIHQECGIQKVKWVIVGAETGNHKEKIIPQKTWIDNIVKQCKMSSIPVFMKDSLISIVGEENMLREFPKELKGAR